jgi:hypothetical protein
MGFSPWVAEGCNTLKVTIYAGNGGLGLVKLYELDFVRNIHLHIDWISTRLT